MIVELRKRPNIEFRLKMGDSVRYRMRLYFNDYPGIKVLSERLDRVFGVFRRSHCRYVSIPWGKKK